MHKKCLLIVVNDLGYFISHRLPIAVAARKAGYEVHVAFGELSRGRESDLSSKGFKLHHVSMHRGGTNVLADLRSIFLLWRLFRSVRPHLIHLVTIKPVLYGGIAARLAHIPAVISAMAGLGFVFIERSSFKAKFLWYVIKLLFRLAIGHPNQILIFQNPDDRDQILAMTRTSMLKTQLIRGSGVDLTTCPVLPELDDLPTVIMASRLLRDKGVLEFVAAARILKERGVSARFWLVGEPDLANPASILPQTVEVWKAEGVVECLGYRSDVPKLYSKAHIVTLPSYREGLPKSLIEAAACGRAVVTTDVPGCRDAIKPDVSGLLVPPRDALALAGALERLIRDTELRQSMAKAGRVLAERNFSIEKTIADHLRIYHQLINLKNK
jgi:glycosyltransferase involved in cell wall biosynthesis